MKTDIVFSYDEVVFLRNVTVNRHETEGDTEKARASLRSKLDALDLDESPNGANELYVVEITLPEVRYLQETTKSAYSFITAEERRARLILREKLRVSEEKLTRSMEANAG